MRTSTIALMHCALRARVLQFLRPQSWIIQIQRLWLVQNSLARVVSKKPKHRHNYCSHPQITPLAKKPRANPPNILSVTYHCLNFPAQVSSWIVYHLALPDHPDHLSLPPVTNLKFFQPSPTKFWNISSGILIHDLSLTIWPCARLISLVWSNWPSSLLLMFYPSNDD